MRVTNYQLGKYLIAMLAMLTAVSSAAQEVAEIPFMHAPKGTVALGGGIRFGQNPYLATDSEDQRRLDLIPLYLYEGKWIFLHGTAGGIHLFDNETLQINLYSRYRFEKLDPESNAFYDGLEERKQTLDAGIQVALTKNWGEIKLTWIADTLNRHNGEEVLLSYRYRFESGPWSFSPFISWSWRDKNLTDYYFGVSEAEARPDRPAYSVGDSQWVGVGMNTAWQLTDRTVLFANIGFGGTDSKVLNSPLVEEAGASQAFIGGTYSFGNVRKPDFIVDENRHGEWSWRVNYGYQADGNIVGEIDQGDFSKSRLANTNIAGATFGKLLTDGETIDFLGRLAIFRHLEENEDNGEFLSYAAYIMMQGKGYSGWSGDELFRWGFGFGVSYAERVPIAEQRKQSGTGAFGKTSHFLNYLEVSLDFPLHRISKANWLRNCYAGLTIVHRSGIFGTSDLLGDVSGGSDWLTAHLECTR